MENVRHCWAPMRRLSESLIPVPRLCANARGDPKLGSKWPRDGLKLAQDDFWRLRVAPRTIMKMCATVGRECVV